jgi:hypothetical protein
MGKVVADKNCEKIHKLSEAIYCCGAGTAVRGHGAIGFLFIVFICLVGEERLSVYYLPLWAGLDAT